ncbi:MAG: NifU family protein [Chlorobiota bacterium]
MQNVSNKIESVVNEINKILQKDGAFIEFVRFEVENRTAVFKLLGTLEHDPMAMNTLRGGVEKIILNKINEVRRIEREI